MPRVYAVKTRNVTICIERFHLWPHRWSYSSSRKTRTKFCQRCLEQKFQVLKGDVYKDF